MRSLVAIVAVSALLTLTGVAAAAAPPPFPNVPGDWSSVTINKKIKGVPHTLILDRGRIAVAGPRRLVIRESDDSLVTVQMTAGTIVQINGLRAKPRQLARGMTVETMRIDGGPAVRVRATF
jgi:hypothetical protein